MHAHSRWAAFAAVLLPALLLPAATGMPCDDGTSITRTPPLDCSTLHDVCVDQQQFIICKSGEQDEPQFQPWNSTKVPPTFSVKELTYNWPNPKGNGDRYTSGWNLHYAPVSIRPNSSEEACHDTRQPVFDPCVTPLILWARWPYNLVEAFATIYTKLWTLMEAGALSRQLLPVLATPNGLRAPSYLPTLLAALFDRRLQTLAQLSSRCAGCGCGEDGTPPPPLTGPRPAAATEAAAASGRCFRTAHLCKLRNREVRSAVSAAQSLARHHAPSLAGGPAGTLSRPSPGPDDEGPPPWSASGPEVLRVVVALRPGAESRSLLNQDEVLASCNAWAPSAPRPLAAAGAGAMPSADDGGGEQEEEGAATASRSAGERRRGLRQQPGSAPMPDQGPDVGAGVSRADQRRLGAWWENVGRSELPVEAPLHAPELAAVTPPGSSRRLASPAPTLHQASSRDPAPAAASEEAATTLTSGTSMAAAGRRLTRESTSTSSPTPGTAAWRSARCIGRVFGSGPGALLRDMAFMGTADVLVCLHGAACLNAYFMQNGSSLVEVRPLGMNKRWANDYFFKPLLWERRILWFGIDVHNSSNSAPSLLEEQKSGLLNEKVRHRERHVRLPWASLQHHLDLIAHIGRDPARYREAYQRGSMYVTDDLQPLPVRPKMPAGVGWE